MSGNNKNKNVIKKKNIKNKMECPICAEYVTKSKVVTCQFCDFKSCRLCNHTYLLGITTDTKCMSCNNKWNLEFCLNNLTKTFVRNKYKKHRQKLLFEKEKARFPESMPLVENYLKIDQMKKEIVNLDKETWELQKKLQALKRRKSNIRDDIWAAENGVNCKNQKAERKVFIKPCPSGNCRGFLSSKWKCGVCNTYVCSKCHEIKGLNPDEPHVCDENNVKAVELIKKEAKNCPSCGIMISKVSGCDQMWCTQCKVAFSWKTGCKVNEVIHNPHYYQWRKEQGIQMRNAGEIACGGLPDLYRLRNKLIDYKITSEDQCLFQRTRTRNKEYLVEKTTFGMIVYEVHQAIRHFQRTMLNPLRRDLNRLIDNTHIRIKYLANEIDEKKMKTTLIRKDTSRSKKKAILDVYELLSNVWTECMVTIFNNPNEIKEQLQKMTRVTILANNELIKISIMYNQVVTVFAANFRKTPRSPIKFSPNYYNSKGAPDHCYKELAWFAISK